MSIICATARHDGGRRIQRKEDMVWSRSRPIPMGSPVHRTYTSTIGHSDGGALPISYADQCVPFFGKGWV